MAEDTQKKPEFWDYATPILTGMGAAAVTGAYNNYAVNKQNQFNAAEAERNRQYETQMSNTAYQRAYADMAAAGLNPHLAGGQGGASTPAGTAATGAQAMPLDIAGSINAANNTALTTAQISNMNADTKLKGEQAGLTKTEIKLNEIEAKWKPLLNKAEIELKNSTTRKQAEEAIKTQIEADLTAIAVSMASMDEAKRREGYDWEVKAYLRQLEAEMIDQGINSTWVGGTINWATGQVGRIFGATYSKASTQSTSTVTKK